MRATLAPVAALLIGAALLLSGHGLQNMLVPLRGDIESFGSLWIGVVGSAYFLGFIAGCLAVPYFILSVGHIRAFTAMVASASAAALLHPLWVDPMAWALFRLITGFCLAGLYLIIESWLNDKATNRSRGMVMSAYIVVNYSAITIGQMLVITFPPESYALFTLASILLSVAAVPVALTRSEQPAPITMVRLRPLALYRISPIGLIGVLMIGLTNGAFWSLGSIFAVQNGFSIEKAATFMSIAVIGGALSQWPLGHLSDRIDRRIVLLMLLVASGLAGALIGIFHLGGGMLVLAGFSFGALALPCYAIAAAHLYDHVDRDAYVEAAASLLMVNGIGSVIGPLVASLAMEQGGPNALFLFTASVHFLLALFVLLRMWQRAPIAEIDKTAYDLPATAPMGALIPPELFEASDEMVEMPDMAEAPTEWIETERDSPDTTETDTLSR